MDEGQAALAKAPRCVMSATVSSGRRPPPRGLKGRLLVCLCDLYHAAVSDTSVGLNYDAREELESTNAAVAGWEADEQMGPIPPGDEGVLASHEGGDAELCVNLLQDRR